MAKLQRKMQGRCRSDACIVDATSNRVAAKERAEARRGETKSLGELDPCELCLV